MGRRRRARGGGEELWALAARLLAHAGRTERGWRSDPAMWVLGEWTFCPATAERPDMTARPLGAVWRPPTKGERGAEGVAREPSVAAVGPHVESSPA